MFLNEISGAFDRVNTTKLLAKLRQLGICETLMAYFEDSLSPSKEHVAVDGAQSFDFVLQNMVFQGATCWPNLWNIFFEDVHEPAGMELRNADSLTTLAFPTNLPSQQLTMMYSPICAAHKIHIRA